MNERRLILILGGARSGKSAFAQQLAAAHAEQVLFVATGEPGDAEMSDRIAMHRAERPGRWRTIEEPRAVARVLGAADPAPVVLLDCVTLWVTNLLLGEDATWEVAARELEAVLAWYHSRAVELIVVSNEVGLGIVPADPVSRSFRDWLGRFNQRLAGEADAVYMMFAGLPVELKALAAAQARGGVQQGRLPGDKQG